MKKRYRYSLYSEILFKFNIQYTADNPIWLLIKNFHHQFSEFLSGSQKSIFTSLAIPTFFLTYFEILTSALCLVCVEYIIMCNYPLKYLPYIRMMIKTGRLLTSELFHCWRPKDADNSNLRVCEPAMSRLYECQILSG